MSTWPAAGQGLQITKWPAVTFQIIQTDMSTDCPARGLPHLHVNRPLDPVLVSGLSVLEEADRWRV